MIVVTAYDRQGAEALVTHCTPRELLVELRGGAFDEQLTPEQRAMLDELCAGWVQRALGDVPLRDVLIIDERHCDEVWAMLCETRILARCVVPRSDATEQLLRADASNGLPGDEAVAVLAPLRDAVAHGGTLAAWNDGMLPGYMHPNWLEALPPVPKAWSPEELPFEQPVGARRLVATLLALVGVSLIALPLLLGEAPTRPAGIPLALLTLALLVGIRAGPFGYAGSLCIWLVPNLPGFHHNGLLSLWPYLPLLLLGLLLLAVDARIRAMWRWIRRTVWR